MDCCETISSALFYIEWSMIGSILALRWESRAVFVCAYISSTAFYVRIIILALGVAKEPRTRYVIIDFEFAVGPGIMGRMQFAVALSLTSAFTMRLS